MVIDKLENLEKYVSLNPLFAEAVAFLKATDLQAHEVGKVVLKEGELMVNFADVLNVENIKEVALVAIVRMNHEIFNYYCYFTF